MLTQVPNINDETETKTSLQSGSYSLLHCFKFLLCFLHLILQSEKERKNIEGTEKEKKTNKKRQKTESLSLTAPDLQQTGH